MFKWDDEDEGEYRPEPVMYKRRDWFKLEYLKRVKRVYIGAISDQECTLIWLIKVIRQRYSDINSDLESYLVGDDVMQAMKVVNLSYVAGDDEIDIDSNKNLEDAIRQRDQSCLKIIVRVNRDLIKAASLRRTDSIENKPSWL
jgi:hypothetical protein